MGRRPHCQGWQDWEAVTSIWVALCHLLPRSWLCRCHHLTRASLGLERRPLGDALLPRPLTFVSRQARNTCRFHRTGRYACCHCGRVGIHDFTKSARKRSACMYERLCARFGGNSLEFPERRLGWNCSKCVSIGTSLKAPGWKSVPRS